MQIIVKYRGQDHRLDLQQSSTLSDLRWQIVEATSVPLANQKLLPKPAKGISLNDDSATLEASGVKDGLTIMLLGASNAEVGKVREEEREVSRRDLSSPPAKPSKLTPLRLRRSSLPLLYPGYKVEPTPQLSP